MSQLQYIKTQWADNPRLRLGGGLIAALLLWYALDALTAHRHALQQRLSASQERIQRLERVKDQTQWPELAEQAKLRRIKLEAPIPAAESPGLAQADQQSWLYRQLQSRNLGHLKTQIDPARNHPDIPGIWRIPLQLSGPITQAGLIELLWLLEGGQKLVNIETLDLTPSRQGFNLKLSGSFYLNAANTPQAPA